MKTLKAGPAPALRRCVLGLALLASPAPLLADLPPRDWSSRFVDELPLPYCNSGSGAGMTLIHDATGRPQLALQAQTSGAEDMVLLDALDGARQLGRCCLQRNGFPWAVQSLADAEGIDCHGLPTLFGGGTDVSRSGLIMEFPLEAPGPGATIDCDCENDVDVDTACVAGHGCAMLRAFDYEGMPTINKIAGLAVVQPEPSAPAFLAVASAFGLDFVDPRSPSCDAPVVERVGSCGRLHDWPGGVLGTIGGLAWAGGYELLIVDHDLPRIYRVDFEDFECEVVEIIPTPEPSQAIAFDRDRRVLHLLGWEDGRLHSTAEYESDVADPPLPVANALRLTRPSEPREDPILVDLNWEAATLPPRESSDRFQVWRGASIFTMQILPGAEALEGSGHVDARSFEPADPALLLYLVVAEDHCGRLSDW